MQLDQVKNKIFNQEKKQVFLTQLDQLNKAEISLEKKFKEQIRLYNLILEEACSITQIRFTSLFSRLAFVSNTYDFTAKLKFNNHKLRIYLDQGDYKKELETHSVLADQLIILNLNQVCGDSEQTSLLENKLSDLPQFQSKSFYRILDIAILKIDLDASNLEFIFKEQAYLPRIANFNHSSQTVDLKNILIGIHNNFALPIEAKLIDVDLADDGIYYPKALVVEPNFLVNITSVAEGFKPDGKTILNYITRKLIPVEGSIHILKGNIVNFILDELIHDTSVSFDSLLPQIFKLFPETFALMNNQILKDLINDLRMHFANLKKTIQEEFEQLGIDKEHSYLEPSFYSANYGFQGRLDLFHKKDDRSIDIIELKSGKVYKPNSYKISVNHYIQTLLYGLLIESVYGPKDKPNCYILYSSQEENRLRFAPLVRQKQREAINHRNKLLFVEKQLLNGSAEDIINLLNPDQIPANYGFIKRDAKAFWDYYKGLDDIERKYYIHFIQFITQEFHLSKVGEHGIEKLNGLASLWLDPIEEKEENFNIISNMVIENNESKEDTPLITFSLSEKSNRISKFRKGDIAVLYPYDNTNHAVLKDQIFKCNIIEVGKEKITIRLRYKQKNDEFFTRHKFWNLEYDVLDSSFNASFYGLYYFIKANKRKRDLILTRVEPDKPSSAFVYENEALIPEQASIISKIINAKDYFLLWGPPGTGKTSYMLKYLVKHLVTQTDENILLLSYTNRSVDEMCAAVKSIEDPSAAFLRMGSRFSTDARFVEHLLSSKMDDISNRNQLVELIEKNRIFISTVSSIQSKHELFKLKKFDTIIVDEASQILEPMLAGLLTRAKKFILIGDHKQLPAVVSQDTHQSIISDEELKKETGIVDLRNSLFERMYLRCKELGWKWAYGTLTKQGRMHQQIMKFNSDHFYEGTLDILENIDRLQSKMVFKSNDGCFDFLAIERIIFIDTPVDTSIIHKTNDFEADLVAILIQKTKDLFLKNDKKFNSSSLGIIAPFRAQIANIIDAARKRSLDLEAIQVDTVERFQGSARDRIIISLTSNNQYLLESISNISSEGVDRKLNVALTRAKEQIIVLGNKKILSSKEIYSELISHAKCLKYEELMEAFAKENEK